MTPTLVDLISMVLWRILQYVKVLGKDVKIIMVELQCLNIFINVCLIGNTVESQPLIGKRIEKEIVKRLEY